MSKIKVMSTGALESGKCAEVQAEGRALVLVNHEGSYYALDGICTHAGGPLAMGWVEDGRIACPLHGAEFDLKTGKRLSMIARADLKSYPVTVEGGEVFVEVSP